ncbi:MAG: hypothetical protein MUE41_13690 [Gemmatimonadaceae bacterium]|jgi:hypothetical protein|nr:hypothetical protein [Gemmatimonadaceae bacterium]
MTDWGTCTVVRQRDSGIAGGNIPAHIYAMKTTIEIPDELYRALKAETARRGISVREVTTALYETWLGRRAADTPSAPSADDVARWVSELEALAARVSALDEMRGTSVSVQVRLERDARE